MKLTFLGTRGYIEEKNRRHRRHTALMVAYKRNEIMIDCGEDWLGLVHKMKMKALVLTHAHPDHAGGLRDGAPCPVHAPQQTWDTLDDGSSIKHRGLIAPRKPKTIAGIRFEAYPVDHSLRCPAVGYRITAGNVTIFYVPDVVYIHDREAALRGARLYIGDGATISRSMVRRQGDSLMGHTPFRTQLTWCEKEGVPEALMTHCGAETVAGDERKLKAELREYAEERGVKVDIAYDGMERVLR